jgi:signal transduction histidine kinase
MEHEGMSPGENRISKDGTPNESSDSEGRRFFRELEIEFLIHELKDPIAIIETGVRTLLERRDKYGALSPRQEKTMQRILRNTRKARGMLFNLLEVGRSGEGCFDQCNFDPTVVTFEVLVEVIEISNVRLYEQINELEGPDDIVAFLSQKGITLKVTPAVASLTMIQDEVKFRQIIANLLKNALHYSHNSVIIDIDQKQSQLCISIQDDGPGIKAADHEHIFKRYTQVSECTLGPRNGHGLGLAGARILARSLGGDIILESTPQQGARFCLQLPLQP